MNPAAEALILSLYRGSCDRPATTFQDWALDRVKAVVPFDTAIWGRAGMENGVATIYSVHLHLLPPDSLASYARFKDRDAVGFRAMQEMGTTFNAVGREVLAHDPEMLEEHVRRYGLEYSLTTCLVDPRSGLLSFLSLFRPDGRSPFTEDERTTAQALVPHLVESCHQSRLMQLATGEITAGRAKSSGNRRMAACDTEFVLIAARHGFSELLREEWTGWSAPRLPEEAREAMHRTGGRHVGGRIVLTWQRTNDLYWLGAREKTPADTLGKRQLEIARLTADGMTYKEIARKLGLAPATVRNHRETVYRKLGIGSRGELATQLSRLD